ncbi:MAG: hypothetical protein NVSMB4_21250 [Acidimicrobiales bacterium]
MADQMFTSGRSPEEAPPEGPLSFDCPRCHLPTAADYWGPCDTCRQDLIMMLQRDGREVGVSAYEPKMNVVPNQVATKD